MNPSASVSAWIRHMRAIKPPAVGRSELLAGGHEPAQGTAQWGFATAQNLSAVVTRPVCRAMLYTTAS